MFKNATLIPDRFPSQLDVKSLHESVQEVKLMLSAENFAWVVSDGGTWDTSSARDETLSFLKTLDVFCSRHINQHENPKNRGMKAIHLKISLVTSLS